MSAALRIGTRRSRLALAQARQVATALDRAGHGPVRLVEISTLGDVSREPLAELGGTGVFASALRDALLADEVDLAVHSLKDLPVAKADGLTIAAIPTREDPRDVLVSKGYLALRALPQGARIGTGSPRRACQLLAYRPDFVIVGVRGNIDTRLGMAHVGVGASLDGANGLDAVVLARAGLARLEELRRIAEVLDPEVMLPAPGQGALAIECRDDREDLLAFLKQLDDPATRVAVTAERALLARTEAGCSAPVGALAEVAHTRDPGAALSLVAEPYLILRAAVGQADGSVRRLSINGPLGDPVGLGHALADRFLAEGADGSSGVRVT